MAALDAATGEAGFWNDQMAAQKAMQELSSLRLIVDEWDALRRRFSDALELAEMAIESGDADMAAELEAEATDLAALLEEKELALAFAGRYDTGPAIFSIHAGAGGTEAQDWASMLLRMYLRWAERHGYRTNISELMEGEEAGIKSATVEVDGPSAYGYLKSERGTHRLVRLSPFDSANRRHTSFAKVEVMPVLDEDIEIQIDPKEIEIEVYLSSGAGGQNVQKNQTAVRIRHLPTGLIVTSQNERSQGQNREMALRVLRGRLYEIEQGKLEAEKAALKGQIVDANFGSQIRSYVLHPYQLVKDLRTDVETGNTQAVLDGDLDAFMVAWLKETMGE